MNIVHTIDTDAVDEQIKHKCEKYLESLGIRVKALKKLQVEYKRDPDKFVRPPDTPEELNIIWEKFVTREKEYYSLVRVIEMPVAGKRFILVYGDADNETVTRGTGPFESLENAIKWFTGGGR